MKPRLNRCSIAAAMMIFALVFGIFLYERARLDHYRRFIEDRYEQELSLIENQMRGGKQSVPKMTEFEALQADVRVRERIGEALSAPEFFAAIWSSDGHHGLRFLKPMPTGYTHSPLTGSRDSDESHTLHSGIAKDGTELLVYVGWVQSDWKRHYQVAFRRAEIDRSMRAGAQRHGPTNAR